MEIWKDIEGYEGLYQVSNLGNVKSLPKKHNLTQKITPEIILRGTNGTLGYKSVTLMKSGVARYFKIHRLVALAFIPNPENKPQVNHKNGIKDDNCVENLEWNTARENSLHSVYVLGKKLPVKPITQLDLAGNHIASFNSLKEAGDFLGRNFSGISACLRGKQKTAFGFIWVYSSHRA